MSAAVFDTVADRYDAEFTDTRLARWLRPRVWAHLDFPSGARVLELGCGTGEDAAWLTARGVSVLATDISPGMLEVARRKAPDATFEVQDASDLAISGSFDGAFANFGVLNCVADLPALAARLPVRRGGRFVAVVMAPFCLWETAWYAVHGDLRRATRRWRPATATIGGRTLPVWYPSARTLEKAMGPCFGLRHCEGLGTLLPPSSLSGLVARWPDWPAGLDRRMPLGQYWADHYIAVFERR